MQSFGENKNGDWSKRLDTKTIAKTLNTNLFSQFLYQNGRIGFKFCYYNTECFKAFMRGNIRYRLLLQSVSLGEWGMGVSPSPPLIEKSCPQFPPESRVNSRSWIGFLQ